MKRTAEFILGLTGSIIFTIIGIVALLYAVFSGGVAFDILPAVEINPNSAISAAIILLIFALLGLAGTILVNKKNTLSGIIMIISGIMGFAISGFPWSFIWSFPLIIAGIMACVPRNTKTIQNMPE